MGIDAEMFVRTKEPVTDTQVEEWTYCLAATFGAERFFIDRKGDIDGRHALTRVAVIHQDGPDILPEPGETFLRVSLWTRYYGKGYERGDFPLIYMIARWLETHIPGTEVWYGGDSSGVLHEPFGPVQREKLLAHFLRHGHFPYAGYPGTDSLGSRDPSARFCEPPRCEFCRRDTVRHGFGRTFAAYHCPGCEWHTETHDGGHTWTTPTKRSA